MKNWNSRILTGTMVALSICLCAQTAAPPTRHPHAPGYVAARDLPDGRNAPDSTDGNFILGPSHAPAPESAVHQAVPHGVVHEFTMSSADSKFYPGIARDPGTFGTADPRNPARLIVTTSRPAPYLRHVAVYVPRQYVPGRPHRLSSGPTARTHCSSPCSTT